MDASAVLQDSGDLDEAVDLFKDKYGDQHIFEENEFCQDDFFRMDDKDRSQPLQWQEQSDDWLVLCFKRYLETVQNILFTRAGMNITRKAITLSASMNNGIFWGIISCAHCTHCNSKEGGILAV